MQISLEVTAKLISVFVIATWIVQSLYYLNPKFQTSRHLVWLYNLVCVGPGRKHRRPFSHNEAQISNTHFLFFCNTYNIQDLIQVVLKVHITNMYYYANMSMQYTAIFHGCENGNFQVTKCNIFLIFVPTIYVLEQK